MVDQDKSMTAMILNDDDKAWMEPLLDIRNELDVKDDGDRRDFRRIWGGVQIFERRQDDGTTKPAPEPMRNVTLIDLEELKRILAENEPNQLNLTSVKPQPDSWAAAKFGGKRSP